MSQRSCRSLTPTTIIEYCPTPTLGYYRPTYCVHAVPIPTLLYDLVYRTLKECDVQLYRQMGNVRDDLNIHEKALDILIELMKKEQVGKI